MAADLCKRCQNFDIQSMRTGGFQRRGYPLVDFVKSARSGCSFCTVLLRSLQDVELDYGSTDKSFLTMAIKKASGEWPHTPLRRGNLLVSMIWWLWPPWLNFVPVTSPVAQEINQGEQGQAGMGVFGMRAFVAAVPGTQILATGSSPEIYMHVAADPGTPAYSSGDVIGRIETVGSSWATYDAQSLKAWHEKCVQNHPACSMAMSRQRSIGADQEVPLPTRCVEIVSVSEQDLDRRPKLVLRETAGQMGRYFALSHRWNAETEAARTTRQNYDSQKQDCAANAIFYDAARIALSQGINLIWIDSLYIIQDDADDWAAESVRMADYYQHAWLTVAATASSETGQGLFGSQKTPEVARLSRLPYIDCDGDQKGYFYLQCIEQRSILRDYGENIGKSKLLQRGWVYQEWMLSRRLVSFTDEGVFVQCSQDARALAGNELNLEDDGENEQRRRQRQQQQQQQEVPAVNRAFKSSILSDLNTEQKVINAWYNVVETFSGLEITRIENDRLIALAGVAKEFGDAVKALQNSKQWNLNNNRGGAHRYQYLCGLWYGQPNYLLWEQAPPPDIGRRARLRGIPTWSWASMELRTVAANVFSTEGETSHGTELRRGMAVRWSDKCDEERTAKIQETVECTIEEAVRIPVDSDQWRPRFETIQGDEGDETAKESDVTLSRYGNDARFFMLRLTGRLLPVLAHDVFQNKGDIEIAAIMTNHGADFGRALWRRVTTVEEPGSVVGWASLEHPDYQCDREPRPEQPFDIDDTATGVRTRENPPSTCDQLFALIVTKMPKSPGGLGFGNLWGYQTAFAVLYLAPKRVPGLEMYESFERVGTGRIFGNEVSALFQATEEKSLWLV